MSGPAAWLSSLILSLGLVSVDAPAHGSACSTRQWDVLPADLVCEAASVAIIAGGVDPAAPFDWTACERGRCRSNLGEMMRLLRCESWLDPSAFDEGWVGVDWHGERVWNRSRGIAQIGDGWEHIATDEQAFDWRWSVWWLGTDIDRMNRYPECGPRKD